MRLLGMVVCARALLRAPLHTTRGVSRYVATEPQIFERTREAIPDGVCCVYKPPGWTSSDVVGKIRGTLERAIRQKGEKRKKVKVGHGGTLDPNARGCLVIGVGTGCRMMQDYLKGGKEYFAVGKLGEATNTLDGEGNVTQMAAWDAATLSRVEALLPQFTGDILQIPPMFSALHKDGHRLHVAQRRPASCAAATAWGADASHTRAQVLARQGIEVERDARPVSVARLQLMAHRGVGDMVAPLALPFFGLDVECGGGTYVRTLIDDLGRGAGSCAHMVELERTRQGPFALEHCLGAKAWDDFDAVCAHVLASQWIHEAVVQGEPEEGS